MIIIKNQQIKAIPFQLNVTDKCPIRKPNTTITALLYNGVHAGEQE